MKRIAFYGVTAAVLGVIMVLIPLTPLILRFDNAFVSEDNGAIDLLTRALNAGESEGYFNGEASPLVADAKSGSFESSMIRFSLVVFMGCLTSLTSFYLVRNRLSNQ
jgi:hypothetical protein